jgi:hypothetical protein
MKTISLDDFKAEAEKRFGPDTTQWQFVCPSCGTAQTAADFVAAGISKEDVNKYIGFSCIGRQDNEKGCDWSLGGLFQIHTLEIITPDGQHHKHFELAEVQQEAGHV